MKGIKLLISIVIWISVTEIIRNIYSQNIDPPGIFGLFFLIWSFLAVSAAVALALRAFAGLNRGAFLYIFITSGALFFGTICLIKGIGNIKRDALWLILYLSTITLTLSMLADTLIFRDNKPEIGQE
jgi:hypothetical protein